ncbi:MAG: type II toxin-antitoxin system VapC family toxin [Solirubrobacterales bacterium]
MSLVLDTGPIAALLDAADPDHDACRAMVDATGEDLVVPAAVLVEVNYWLRKWDATEAWCTFTEDLQSGAYRLHQLDPKGVVRAAELEQGYASLDLGFVDAAVIITCEQLGETKVATLDRRDFSVVRPAHCDALRLLPE